LWRRPEKQKLERGRRETKKKNLISMRTKWGRYRSKRAPQNSREEGITTPFLAKGWVEESDGARHEVADLNKEKKNGRGGK